MAIVSQGNRKQKALNTSRKDSGSLHSLSPELRAPSTVSYLGAADALQHTLALLAQDLKQLCFLLVSLGTPSGT